MFEFGLILVAFLAESSSAYPIGLPSDFSSYQPCYGLDPCTVPYSQYPSVLNAQAAVVGPDPFSPVPTDIAWNYPYANPRTVNYAQENYARNYGFGSTEVGVRDQVSMRINNPAVFPPYSKFCSYFPVGTCFPNVNRRWPWNLPADYAVAY